MALDAVLLDQAIAAREPQACLRLYSWTGPWLSLGYHQRHLPNAWLTLAEQGAIGLVRRPSGGRAVLHAGSLTYALISPRPAGDRHQTYRHYCGWLQRAFDDLGLPLHFGERRAAGQQASCFATASGADLVHGNGAKRIGSAQLWRRGVLLQHGSLLIDPPSELWWQLFNERPPDLPALPEGEADLVARLRRAAEKELCGEGLVERTLDRQEWNSVQARMGRLSAIVVQEQGLAPLDWEARAPSPGQTADETLGPIKP
jgi:lipoate-protein ligase A